MNRIIAECENRLDAAGREAAITCARYQEEEDELNEVIEYEEQAARLKVKEDELGKMSPPARIQNLPSPLAVALIIVAILLAYGGLKMVPTSGRWEQSTPTVFFFIGACMVLVVGGWGFLPKGKNAALILEEEVTAERDALRRSFPESRLQKLRLQFGNGDVGYYRNLLAERTTLLEKIMDTGESSSAATNEVMK